MEKHGERHLGNVEKDHFSGSLLSFTGVSKSYGKRKALCDVSFNLGPGKIVGLLGSNGSGKTTLMKIAAGILPPTSGSVSILGRSPGVETKAMVSYMPDQPVTELWMSVRQAICFYQDFYQDFDRIKASEMLQFMRIKPEDRVGTMSKGMSERLQLVLTMSRKARLYLLDEPIGGVDPVARDRIMDALVQFYNEDSSIILSTHLISNIERIFDEVIFIKDGQISMQDDVENIRLNRKKSIDELFKEVYAEC